MKFRGILSLLLNPPANERSFRKGLMILSCSEHNALRIREFARQRDTHIDWEILYRYDPTGVFKGEKLLLSSDAMSLIKKLTLLKELRSRKYDVVYVAWTNEPSYSFLKVFALFSNFGYLRVFNENLGAFYFIRSNYKNWKRHLLWRSQSQSEVKLFFLNTLSWIFLFPLGLLYLLFQTARYTIVGAFSSVTRKK